MSQPIKRAEIARHWGVSPAYVTLTLKRHGAGDLVFASLEEADRWRAVHAPENPTRANRRAMFAGKQPQSPTENSAVLGEKNRGSSGTTSGQSQTKTPPATTAADGNHGSGDIAGLIDVASMVERGGDFDAIMLRQAEEVPQIAYGLYRRACGKADSVEIANATRNWNDAAKASAGVREKYLEIQEKTRALIPLDLVMDIVGTELQAVRVGMLKGGERFGAKANPDNPALAKAVIDEFVDGIFRGLDVAASRVSRELSHVPEEETAPA